MNLRMCDQCLRLHAGVEEGMVANPCGVAHGGAAGLPSGLPVFNVAGTSVGIRILALQGQQTPLGGGLSVQRAAEVSVSLSRFPSLSLPPSLLLPPLSYSIFCAYYDTDKCSSCKASNFC